MGCSMITAGRVPPNYIHWVEKWSQDMGINIYIYIVRQEGRERFKLTGFCR